MNVTAHVTAEPADLHLIASALLEAADRRRRTGIVAAGELQADRAAGLDVSAAALAVIDVLAEADTLEHFAQSLAAAAAAPAPEPAPQLAQTPAPPDPLADALARATAAVQAARNGSAIPSVEDLAGAYNAHLAATPVLVDGTTAWMAPGIDDPDPEDQGDDPDAEDVLLEEMQA